MKSVSNLYQTDMNIVTYLDRIDNTDLLFYYVKTNEFESTINIKKTSMPN